MLNCCCHYNVITKHLSGTVLAPCFSSWTKLYLIKTIFKFDTQEQVFLRQSFIELVKFSPFVFVRLSYHITWHEYCDHMTLCFLKLVISKSRVKCSCFEHVMLKFWPWPISLSLTYFPCHSFFENRAHLFVVVAINRRVTLPRKSNGVKWDSPSGIPRRACSLVITCHPVTSRGKRPTSTHSRWV